MSKLICKVIEKSRTFGSEDAHGNIHFIVSCQFAKPSKSGNRFTRSLLGGSLYQKSLDLQLYYPSEDALAQMDDVDIKMFDGYEPNDYYTENKRTHEVEFDGDKAFEDFCSENKGQTFEGLNAWDIPMIEATNGKHDHVITSDGQKWATMYVAEEEDLTREDVVSMCQRSIANMLASGAIEEPQDEQSEA